MGASPRHLSAPAARGRHRRQIGLAVAVVVVLVGVVTTVVIRRADDGSGHVVTVAGDKGGRGSDGHTPATTPPSGYGSSTSARGSTEPGTGTSTSTTSAAAASARVLDSPAASRWLGARTGRITAAVYDIDTGTTSLWHPGVTEDTASIVKVDILETLLHGAQDSDGDGDDDDDDDDAVTPEQQDLATSMIEESDNDSATDLWNDVGAAAGIAAYDRLVPLTDTVPGADGYWGLTTTTAADQVALVKQLALPGALLDKASRDYQLNLMEHIEPFEDWGVSAGIPAGVTVALKNGWLPLTGDDWQVNSIGWVDGQGRDYVIAVLTDGEPTEAYGIDTIQGLSSIVWNQLAP